MLAWLHELYVEGLMDPDFVTVDEATTKANLMNGISGVTCGGLAAGIGTMIQTMSPSNPEFNLIGVPSLVAKDGDRAYSGHCTASVNTTAAAISADCENVELALQFLNYAFTEEGRMLTNFGVKGVSYEMVDGQPKYTELITKNPNGLNITQALAQYANSGQNTMGIAIAQDERYIYEYSQYDVQDETLRLWTDNDAQEHLLPTLSVSDTELLAQINTEYYAYVGESISDFIKGTRSLDEFDDFVKELETIGVPTMVDLYQEALDKYNAN